jgi:orotate phosphoribosyltransferase
VERLTDLLAARRGHFLLESGHHGDLWLELDALFVRPRRVAPFAADLARRLAPHGVEVVCGPLVGGALVAQLVAGELDAELCWTERTAPPAADALYTAEYRVPSALRDGLRGKRVAIVDDVINAGSATRATLADLHHCGAEPAAIAALLVLNDSAASLAAAEGIPLEHTAKLTSGLWEPADCPLCAASVPLEDMRSE